MEKALRILTSTASVDFNPTTGRGYQPFVLLDLFLDTLVVKDQQGQFVASIADRWEQSSDGKRYQFYINPKRCFHDYTPIRPIDLLVCISRHFIVDGASAVAPYLGVILETPHLRPDGTL